MHNGKFSEYVSAEVLEEKSKAQAKDAQDDFFGDDDAPKVDGKTRTQKVKDAAKGAPGAALTGIGKALKSKEGKEAMVKGAGTAGRVLGTGIATKMAIGGALGGALPVLGTGLALGTKPGRAVTAAGARVAAGGLRGTGAALGGVAKGSAHLGGKAIGGATRLGAAGALAGGYAAGKTIGAGGKVVGKTIGAGGRVAGAGIKGTARLGGATIGAGGRVAGAGVRQAGKTARTGARLAAMPVGRAAQGVGQGFGTAMGATTGSVLRNRAARARFEGVIRKGTLLTESSTFPLTVRKTDR